MNTTRLALLACALLCASAHAQEPNSAASGFAALDANKDRMLSRAEAAADKDLARVFSKVDLNKDGKLNEDEYLKGVSLYQREKTSQFASDGT
ncbi:MAG: hypothetical protein RLZZ401_1456, partial [Pseudomonadota bacterium]